MPGELERCSSTLASLLHRGGDTEFQNRLELYNAHSDPRFREAFISVFTAAQFSRLCIRSDTYTAPERLRDLVVETPAGAEFRKDCLRSQEGLTEADATLALLQAFYHHDLFVEPERCDAAGLYELLNNEVIAGQIRYPWVYGRVLYDRFSALFPNKTESLTHAETLQLMEGTPIGVFQLHDSVIGPFGILRSKCHRTLEPTITAALWHCSDPACSTLHSVKLRSGSPPVLKGMREAETSWSRRLGPPCEWTSFFYLLLRPVGAWYDHLNTSKLPWLVANALDPTELTHLVARILETDGKDLRTRLPQAKRFQNLFIGSPTTVSERLDVAQRLQLVLLATDSEIIDALEYLIERRDILVPPTEMRDPVFSRSASGWFDPTPQISDLGVRLYSKSSGYALGHLKSVVQKVYSTPEDQEALRWKLRHASGSSLDEKLMSFLYQADLEAVVSSLFFDTPSRLAQVFAALRYGRFAVPDSPSEERRTIRKLIWSFGFGTYSFPDGNQKFWERLRSLEAEAKVLAGMTEEAKEKLRSIAVNVFVSVEELLDASLAFIGWVLLEDHYSKTKFRFNVDEARQFVAGRLNARGAAQYDATGKNTLYPLVVGLDTIAAMCAEYRALPDYSEYVKPDEECPGYACNAVHPFPLRHTVFMMDLRAEDVDHLINGLRTITKDLTKADLMAIRNRMDHQRPDFPSRSEISDMCAVLGRVVTFMEDSGICPLLYRRKRQIMDGYGRGEMVFERYNGREVSISWPPLTSFLPKPNTPQTLVPGLRFGSPAELVRFRYHETSAYVRLWSGYPTRTTRTRQTSKTAASPDPVDVRAVDGGPTLDTAGDLPRIG